ncbi:Uncharacterised protein [Mycobacteroides abscessus subsp. abscessus]|nr:Uncharacterised protein [Mycobacteroides abscessus subsp. abscessus]
MLPTGTAACGHDAQNARLRSGLCSATSSTAPPHSPPTAKPWMNRNVTNVGRQPIRKVAAPTSSRLSCSSFLRPYLSPKWPNTTPPSGRAAKPTA